ncbi:MAG: class I SAM-dependent methyltransferase [Planctomycetes bacterium]|nr:class I SAM-dependent methyltransferase [Planctomycetota bacterium]
MSPQPPAKELQKLYSREKGYYATVETDLSRIPASANEWLHALLKQVHTPGKQFLDVGCANGQLMYHMNSFGWNVCGVDINPDTVSIARSNGLDARCGTLQESSLPAGSFHAIHLGDVIEHVPSPGGMLARVFELLQSRGIVVIRTPNNQNGYARLTTILSQVTGMAWTQSEAPYHLFEFSAKSLSQLLTRHGFVVVSSASSGRSSFTYRIGATGYFDELKRTIKHREKRRGRNFLWQLPRLMCTGLLLAPFYGAGSLVSALTGQKDSLLVVARKP